METGKEAKTRGGNLNITGFIGLSNYSIFDPLLGTRIYLVRL